MILPINQRCTFTVAAANITALVLVTNGSINNSVSIIQTPLGSGLVSLSFVPNMTGIWQVIVNGSVEVRFQVTESDLFQTLKDVKDASLGSWIITDGVLKLYRSDNSLLSEYDITTTSKSLRPT